ncbi:UDP-glucose 6-dehydrogenase [Chromatiales bacterium (ex Bugula neritina AB1)]|nr:UDP-glucose 6-dehydrogenase [Chromatiales bacterium (ex Bugula neritina AB1)]
MNVTIYGSGYVGLVTGSLLADVGNNVLCVDIDEKKVANLNKGIIPIHEPGLDAVILRNVEIGRLSFTTDMDRAVSHSEMQFIAVGTPPDEDGSADLQHVLAVAQTIAERMDSRKLVVTKSTVPVGTSDKVGARMHEVLAKRGETIEFTTISNPEFLKEGAAIEDFRKPDRIVVGTQNPYAMEEMRKLYAPFCRNHDRLIFMDIRSSELTKYAANSMLATKISFMNELSNLADALGADIENVRIGIGSDPRIGYSFIYPGCGYGGSCFPKDVKALVATAREVGYHAELLESVESVNERQKNVLFEKLNNHFNGDLSGKTFALWGLAFKPNTDDMREAPSRVLMEALWAQGAKVQAYDPVAMDETRSIYPDKNNLALVDSATAATQGADALIICTEWHEFRSPDWDGLKQGLTAPVIFDGRNLYEPEVLSEHGISYYCIGRRQAA